MVRAGQDVRCQEGLVVHPLGERRDGRGLVLEVEVERRPRDTRPAGDVGDVDRLEARLLQVVVERFEDRRPPQVATRWVATIGGRAHLVPPGYRSAPLP